MQWLHDGWVGGPCKLLQLLFQEPVSGGVVW
jgi:hypothetical protein